MKVVPHEERGNSKTKTGDGNVDLTNKMITGCSSWG